MLMFKSRLNLVLLVVCLLVSSCNKKNSSSQYEHEQVHNTEVLWLTDIHFNPYSECKPGVAACLVLEQLIENPIQEWSKLLPVTGLNGYKEETNNALFTQGLQQLTAINKGISTIFISGDILSHKFDSDYYRFAPAKYNNPARMTEFSNKLIAYVLYQIHNAFPKSKIYMVLGNNDTDNGDYNFPSVKFLRNLATVLKEYSVDTPEFIDSFSQGGYFTAAFSNQVDLIGLNTNVLAAGHTDIETASKQLAWLKHKLEQAQAGHRSVIILQHIPYGVDSYQTAIKNNNTYFWLLDQKLQQEYLQLLGHYSAITDEIYTGHLHLDSFALVNGITPVITSIALNSDHSNNPGFRIITINDHGHIVDSTTYITSLLNQTVQWKPLYNLSTAYGVGVSTNLSDLIKDFPYDVNSPKVIAYRHYFNGDNTYYPQPIAKDNLWRYYYCGINNITEKTYRQCLAKLCSRKLL